MKRNNRNSWGILPILLMLLIPFTSAEVFGQTGASKVRDWGKDYCDSIIEVNQSFLNSHKRLHTIIDTNNIPLKINHQLKIPFADSVLVYKDDTTDGIYTADIIGIDKKAALVLVRVQDEIDNIYILIDQHHLTVNRLSGYPLFYGDKVVCLEDDHTDWSGRFVVYQIENGRLNPIFSDALFRCGSELDEFYEMPHRIELSQNNELIHMAGNRCWLIKKRLF